MPAVCTGANFRRLDRRRRARERSRCRPTARGRPVADRRRAGRDADADADADAAGNQPRPSVRAHRHGEPLWRAAIRRRFLTACKVLGRDRGWRRGAVACAGTGPAAERRRAGWDADADGDGAHRRRFPPVGPPSHTAAPNLLPGQPPPRPRAFPILTNRAGTGRLPSGAGPVGMRTRMAAVTYRAPPLPFLEREVLRPACPGVEVVTVLRALHAVECPRCCCTNIGGRGFGAGTAGGAAPLRAPVPRRLPIDAGPVGIRMRMPAVRIAEDSRRQAVNVKSAAWRRHSRVIKEVEQLIAMFEQPLPDPQTYRILTAAAQCEIVEAVVNRNYKKNPKPMTAKKVSFAIL